MYLLWVQYLRPLNFILLLSNVENSLFHSILATLLTKRRNQKVEMEDLDGGDPRVRANGLAIWREGEEELVASQEEENEGTSLSHWCR